MAEAKTTQTIDQLQKRYEDLNKQKITAEANHQNATEQLAALKAAALRDYQTDDLDQLKLKLKQMQAENEQKRSAYQAHLDKIEAELKDVDQKHSQPPTVPGAR